MNEALIERFNRFTTREKLVLLLTFFVVLWSLWDNLVYQPLTSNQKQISSEINSLQTQLSTIQTAAEKIELNGLKDPNKKHREKLHALKNKVSQIKQQMGGGEKQFVPPHLMIEVLSNILKQNIGLELIKLETLAVTPLSETNTKNPWVYRHGLSYTLEGSYLDTLSYLKSLESLPWRFNWDSIDYEVTEYPVAKTTLRIYTLSFEENWLEL